MENIGRLKSKANVMTMEGRIGLHFAPSSRGIDLEFELPVAQQGDSKEGMLG